MAGERPVIAADEMARLLNGIEPIGLGPSGTNRLAWTPEDAAAAAWFEREAEDAGLAVERDPAGSLWAVPDAPAPWWGVGSHLDSVRDGGRYDGALGVCAALAIARASERPVAVIAFADEEGARFNTPTFGSRALVGRLDAEEILARRDDGGTTLREAMAAAGVDPDGLAAAHEWLPRLRGFLELHIDQTPDVDEPYAVVRGLASRMRVQADLHGRADHAGTTSADHRDDALLKAARLIVAAADAATPGMVATASRILVEPNALTTIAAHVRLWLDARAPEPGALDAWLEGVRPYGEELLVASRSDGVTFDAEVRRALGDEGGILCFAGHDAGILAERLPAGMLLVRNETGISHAPEEAVDLDDAARAATAMLHALERLP
jgi:beta-ureidopropionase / N-carbamoyl-L-amino-acid hydrolase